MHVWLDFVIKLQKYISLAYSSWTSGSAKTWDAAVPDQLLAASANVIAYQMEEYENSDLVVILLSLNSFQHKNYMAFSLLYVLLKENQA